ncbi:ABC transporter substrate-binding protein [Natronoglycomyces albus]|uniref:Solute-binding protein family 5 domain-containing protein n=1 Tax=Natronoglycomyces albus TaxID=2811108 RepID=A0A895XHE4_9ACTN|nr:ABC transporter substrate-binding protein [Natronoglycomyces albus]QSB05261.1 hypothetical protein JQS30_16145 [Natronoglycomyces albus]
MNDHAPAWRTAPFARRLGVAASAALLAVSSTACTSENDGRQLRVLMADPPEAALSPHSNDAYLLSRWSVSETLVTLDEDGELSASLATGWSMVDDNRWEIELREGVRFHDGTTMDAAAVENALNAAAESATKPRVLEGIELTAEATGDHTLLVSTASPDATLLQRLASPQLAILATSAYRSGDVDPVGAATGPFRISESTNGGAQMKRFDDYWGAAPALTRFRAEYVADPHKRAMALRGNSADIAENIPASELVHLHAGQVQDSPTSRSVLMYLNTDTGPFADEGLRAAAREAIEPESLIDGLYAGHADEPIGLFGPSVPWRSDVAAEFGEAGPVDSDRIDLVTYSNTPQLAEVMALVSSQLEDAGFEVTTTVREYSQVEGDVLGGHFDAFILSRSTVLDSGDPYSFLESDFSCNGVFNISQWCTRGVDTQIATMAAATPGDERISQIAQVEAEILGSVAAIVLLHERLITGVGPGVENVAQDPREFTLITPETTKR